ncbi:MAG: LURP-one-related family protein [Lachnospiraceae bacterium]|nr:LURP-one-related family protein [Lachnospiraceae bacterium]
MKLLFKQRFFSWFDSYDIYDEDGNVVFTVEGQLSWGHKLHILNSEGVHVGTVKEVVLTFLPKFELYVDGNYIGCISKQLTFFKPAYEVDFNGWEVSGNFMEWDYEITDSEGSCAAVISKELWNFTDTYMIDVTREEDALYALMMTLAIDAEKCSRN